MLENACFRVRAFSFRARRDDAHGRSLQREAPTVGALGDAVMDENERAINRHFQVSRVCKQPGNINGFLVSIQVNLND